MPAAATDTTALKQRLTTWAQAAFDRSTDLLEQALRDAAPLGTTGATVRGIQVLPLGGGANPAAQVISTGKGGSFVEEGTEPHAIVASGNALRFLWGGGRISQPGPSQRVATTRGAGVVFFKSVQHPGFPARPWFDPTVQRWATEFLPQAAESVPF